MGATKNQNLSNNNAGKTVEVLYQKMGDRWFAFSLIEDEVFVGSISQEEIDSLALEAAPANNSNPVIEC